LRLQAAARIARRDRRRSAGPARPSGPGAADAGTHCRRGPRARPHALQLGIESRPGSHGLRLGAAPHPRAAGFLRRGGRHRGGGVSMNAKICVVIVNYRTAALVVECLRSLATQIPWLPLAEVIVVDNASGDGSVELLRNAIASRRWGGWVSLL